MKLKEALLITRNVKMKKRLKNVIFLLLLLKMCFIFGQETMYQKCIVIDVGHGGKDPGAFGINGIQEKDVVLNIGKEVIKQNRAMFNNTFEIYLTRYTDTLISLNDRTKLAKALNPDLFISLHSNHSNSPNARGIEVYVVKNGEGYSKQSVLLGYIIQEELKIIGLESRGIKFSNFFVIRKTSPHCPAILIESGFITNPDEGSYLSLPSNIRTIAVAILKGIIDYSNMEL